MKSFNVIQSFCLWVVFAAIGLLLTLSGCAGSPGKTTREIHRDHINKVSVEWLMLQQDIDEFLMMDRPSRLSDKISR